MSAGSNPRGYNMEPLADANTDGTYNFTCHCGRSFAVTIKGP